MKQAYIFDIDGTLCDCTHRLCHIQSEPKNWDKFYGSIGDDAPIKDVIRVAEALNKQGYSILLVTGRPDNLMIDTIGWFKWNTSLKIDGLFFRKKGDYRPDSVIKKEMYETKIKDNFNVLGVFEDRKQVVDMWRSLGLTCFQVAEGDY